MQTTDVVFPDAVTLTPVAAPMTIAGFWRRLAAFLVDMLLLGFIGAAAGSLFHERFAAMGVWGRAVGFLIVVAYFGMTECRWGGGRSPGKRLFRLRVVSRSGTLLGTPAALCRTAIFCLAYFLNGVNLQRAPGQAWLTLLQSILVSALFISVFYLLVFNRRTRQSTHDLATGAFVVKAAPGPLHLPALPVWRGHFAIVGAAILVLAAGGLVLQKQKTVASILATQQAVSMLPDIDRVTVTLNFPASGQTLSIGGVIDASLGDPEALGIKIADIALATFPQASAQRQIIVTLAWGYDIGIAAHWKGMTYTRTPARWRALARPPA